MAGRTYTYSDRFTPNAQINPSDRTVTFKVIVKSHTGDPIVGATVTWQKDNISQPTIRGGIASRVMGESVAPDEISATGYMSEPGVIVEKNDPKYVVMNAKQSTYYYSFYTVDTRGNYIPSVDVEVYAIGETSTPKAIDITPLRHFKYIYTDANGGPLNFKFIKNGYKNVTSGLDSNSMIRVSPNTSISEANNNPVTIVFEATTNATYYYAVQVKDDNNNPVSGVTFETYKDLGATDPYMYTPIHISNKDARGTLLKRVKEILSSQFNIPVSSIKESDDLVKDYGADSLDFLDLSVALNDEYNISISESDFRNDTNLKKCDNCGHIGNFENNCPSCGHTKIYRLLDSVGGLVDYIQIKASNIAYSDEPKCFIKVPKPFTNGSNGLSTINQETATTTSNAPSPIYVKVVSIPNTYSSTGLGVYAVQPTLTPTTPGCTIVLHSKSGAEMKYYNFVVTDKITGTPVEDANVTYVYNDEVISDQNTAANGEVRFSYAAASLIVSIYKSGYEEYSDVQISGLNEDNYLELQLTPKNTVRVIYTDGEPAAGLNVEIFNYSNGKKIVTNRLTTHTNGYIDTLDSSLYYLNTHRYVTVVNYDIDDKTRLTKTLIPGNLVIEIPYIDEDSDSDIDYYSFEEFADMSINNIKNFVKKGNSELKNTGSSDKVSYNSNDFRIDILDPDTVSAYDIFESYPVMMYNNQKSVIGSVDIGLKSDANQLRLKMINRYSGYYNPIFKDILFYYNFETVKGGVVCPYSNTAFDYNYSDNYGKFGTINNLWFHKANDNKNIEIINSLTPYFPLTGQYALDHRDYNIFSSSWDMDYYTRQTDLKNSESCRNIASMKNDLCMFGSKYLNVPNTIEICGFRLGDDKNWNGEWNDDWITNPEGCPGEMMYKEINDNSVEFYFFFTKRILRYFYENLKDEFEKYISENKFSYGNDGLEDDIKEYVSKNVLKLYRLEKVRLFVRRIKVGQHNSKIENNYTEYLEFDPDDGRFCDVGYFRRQNFNDVKTISLMKMNRDDFDRKIVYNLRTGMKEEFGFSFILTKI